MVRTVLINERGNSLVIFFLVGTPYEDDGGGEEQHHQEALQACTGHVTQEGCHVTGVTEVSLRLGDIIDMLLGYPY
jgi:hypothetical protein